MNLYQLNYFLTMAKFEHYTKAAKELSMTQPSLSHAISSLEEELGAPLFKKHGRNVKLTKYGKRFFPYVKNALREIDNGCRMVKEMSETAVSLGFIYTLSSEYIPKIISEFLKKEEHKCIKFHLMEGSGTKTCTETLVRDLKEEKLDLILISLIPNDPEIEFILLGEQNLVAVLPNNCPLANNESIDLSDTKPYSLIQYAGKVGLKQEIKRLFEKVGMVPNVSCEVEDELTMAGLVAANIGIAIVPDSPTIRNYKNVKVLPISKPVYSRKIYLGYMKDYPMTKSVEIFKSYVISSSFFTDDYLFQYKYHDM